MARAAKKKQKVSKAKANAAKKKPAAAAAATKKKKIAKKVQSPVEEYFARLQAKQTEIGALGSMLVTGIDTGDDEYEKEDEEGGEMKEEPVYTQEQVDTLRHMLITARRNEALEATKDDVLAGSIGYEPGEDAFCLCFNTSYADHCAALVAKMVKMSLAKAKLPRTFDTLVGRVHWL
jgi:hypothetical protein